MSQEWLQVTNYYRLITDFHRTITASSLIFTNWSPTHHQFITDSSSDTLWSLIFSDSSLTHHRRILIIDFHRLITNLSSKHYDYWFSLNHQKFIADSITDSSLTYHDHRFSPTYQWLITFCSDDILQRRLSAASAFCTCTDYILHSTPRTFCNKYKLAYFKWKLNNLIYRTGQSFIFRPKCSPVLYFVYCPLFFYHGRWFGSFFLA